MGIHRLEITYDKLKKQIVISKQRLRSEVEMLFPEFPSVLKLEICRVEWKESAATKVSLSWTEVKDLGREDIQSGRHIQNDFARATGEVRSDFKERYTLSELERYRCQRTDQ